MDDPQEAYNPDGGSVPTQQGGHGDAPLKTQRIGRGAPPRDRAKPPGAERAQAHLDAIVEYPKQKETHRQPEIAVVEEAIVVSDSISAYAERGAKLERRKTHEAEQRLTLRQEEWEHSPSTLLHEDDSHPLIDLSTACLVGENPSRHCRDAIDTVQYHTTTAMHKLSTPSPQGDTRSLCLQNPHTHGDLKEGAKCGHCWRHHGEMRHQSHKV